MRKKIFLFMFLSLLVSVAFADNLTITKTGNSSADSQEFEISVSGTTAKVSAFQFDVVLPKGAVIDQDKNDAFIASLGNKNSDHQLYVAKVGANTYRFLSYSMTNTELPTSDTPLLYFNVSTENGAVLESTEATVEDMLLVDGNGTETTVEGTTFDLGNTTSIKIGSKGKSTFTGKKPLDFSFSDEIKAYVATGYESNGTIWLTRVKQVPANTPILIKGEADKTYEVPVMGKCVAYFENMFQGSAGEDVIINSTTKDGKYKNFYMADGIFKPAPDNKTIKAGKSYLQVPASFKASKAGDDQTVKIADSGKSSYAPPVDIDLTDVEGLKAYAATGYDAASQTIWLTRINKIQAGEGVMLKGESGKEYTLHASEVQAYYGNMFVGNIGSKITINETSDDGEWRNFYLASGQFKKVSGSREIGTNKSYLQLPTSLLVSNARGKQTAGIDEWLMEELETETMLLGSIGDDDEDGTTRIDAICNENAQPDVYYNLQGQRVENPGKGIYIKNGKKIILK